ncbi:MAG: UDP-N-acetylglucosamine 1-carboxyvinyltransferase [Candidatus Kapabacteria bacterium]|nr:UDP-N-acetylglucosamine 1-carboxyvinyltransferase [Candidatus Kapabacteria bacterium]
MDKFIVDGGIRLEGSITVSGAKNASLALMPTCLLTPDAFRLLNTPDNRDVLTFRRLLESMGITSAMDGHELTLDSSAINSHTAPYEHVKKMRASIYVLGPLVARYGKAHVSLPGGCNFGPRPVDLHLKGLERLGATITIEGGYINATAERLHGAHFHFDVSSVGATVNVMMAATLAKGETLLTNAATEPEVASLASMLVEMGAIIDGIGTTTLRIQGVDALHGVTTTTIPDRIEAGTFLIAGAMTKGDLTLENVEPLHLSAELQALQDAGCTIDTTANSIRVRMDANPEPVDITTTPYPGFPTDTQAQWAAFMLQAKGAARVRDTIYPTRFGYVPELQRLGADIETGEGYCVVKGGTRLTGATVMSSDLRASASLVMAGMIADGQTEVLRVYHIDRGYESIEHKLNAVGARIRRESTQEF